MVRLGLLGGTFDPPHRGHQVLATAALRSGLVDEVVLMVAGDPYVKRGSVVAGAEDRLAMTQALAASLDHVVVRRDEIDRDGPSYTIDTVDLLLGEGVDQVLLVVGADLASQMDTWHGADRLASLCTVLAAHRPGAERSWSPRWTVELLGGVDDPCASRDLRQALLSGEDVEGCIPPSVLHVIGARGLYDGHHGASS